MQFLIIARVHVFCGEAFKQDVVNQVIVRLVVAIGADAFRFPLAFDLVHVAGQLAQLLRNFAALVIRHHSYPHLGL